ncbi:carbohydrate ABC transporter permease [Flexivirga sp. ID2601S]|uniref:Carbohydrate ABC transporter permease n=1 Tax=Flexivirga aerilata TaxID=1656889 RepID=A0A849AG51_9MICO|nr:carbohydrate ABC transporter permease [Flexivirga aerilata]NNG39445.1 carbohydrate ABC transporter permease [Flexivirga aerilata]
MATIPTPAPRARTSAATGERRSWKLTTVLALASLAVFIPLYLAVTMALKTNAEASSGSGFALPTSLHWSNFSTAWNLVHFPRAAAVSVVIAVVAVVGSLAVSSMAAYAIVRNWHRKAFRYSYFYLLAAMFIPFPVIALPQVKLTALLGLDNPIGVGLLHVLLSMGFNILLYTAFLRSIPFELEESARLDGASTWQTFRQLIVPLLGPMNATVGIFAFLASWNDYMMPAIITADAQYQSLPVVQNIFAVSLTTNYNVAFASYLMAMLPTLVVYFLAQRWVLSGVTQGAIK